MWGLRTARASVRGDERVPEVVLTAAQSCEQTKNVNKACILSGEMGGL